MTTTRIIFADLNKQQLVMYREDGSTITIYQGDVRIANVVSKVFPDIEANGFCDLPDVLLDKENPYHETEKKMNGFVRFFKVLKTKLSEIVGKHENDEPLVEKTAGDIGALDALLHPPVVTTAPTPVAVAEPAPVPEEAKPLTKSLAAVAEIMANATPTSSQTFADADEASTTVAILADGTIIDNAHKLETQFKAVNAGLSSEDGLKNFLNRMASVKRAHSAQDLLTFMEKGELPIADDGSVLVYKRLRSTGEDGVFVDCHTQKVKQSVGSHVFMDESLVDGNRHNECSNGLHVARRDYLRSFSGDVCVLAKLAPEDVIAVPHGDARKLRARGYHIIAVLTKEDHDRVTRNQPLKDETLLGNAIAGNHVAITNTVQITKHHGGGVIYNKVNRTVHEVVLDTKLAAGSLDDLPQEGSVQVDAVALATRKKEPEAPVFVEPKPTKKVFKEEAPAPATKPMTRLQVLETDFTGAVKGSATEHAAAVALVFFKKSSKKSWTALGIPVAVFDRATALAAGPAPSKPVKEVVEVVKATKPAKKASKPVKKAKQPDPLAGSSLNAQESLSQLVARAIRNKSQALAKEAVAIKKAKKKGWSALGVADDQATEVVKLAGK